MLLEHLQSSLERAPARTQKIVADIQALQKEGKVIEFYLEALRLLRVSWRDEDPGKHTAHWYAFSRGRKVWPRELVNVREVDAFDEKRIMRHPKTPSTPLDDFHRLDREACPSCKTGDGIVLGCYEQTEDGPHGDAWSRSRYVACASCMACYPLGTPQVSGHRFL